jgi:hypothetical protein
MSKIINKTVGIKIFLLLLVDRRILIRIHTVPCINGSGSGRPKIWIRWIRILIHNTAVKV